MNKKRLRIFAGPNGSGKSTIKNIVSNYVKLGTYVNADEIKVELTNKRRLDFSDYEVGIDKNEFIESLHSSSYSAKIDDVDTTLSHVSFLHSTIIIDNYYEIEDYFVSFIAEFIREKLLENSYRFTFETVMSHPSKLEFMKRAKENGFKIYLYFVSLIDPQLNKLRVRTRVRQGGHAVDEQKIEERYKRTMGLLLDALRIADNAYLFDNSAGEPNLFAIKEDGIITIQGKYVPAWFITYVTNKV